MDGRYRFSTPKESPEPTHFQWLSRHVSASTPQIGLSCFDCTIKTLTAEMSCKSFSRFITHRQPDPGLGARLNMEGKFR